MGFLNISSQAEIHKIPKTWEKNMGKNKHSKVTGFSNILGEAEISTFPET